MNAYEKWLPVIEWVCSDQPKPDTSYFDKQAWDFSEFMRMYCNNVGSETPYGEPYRRIWGSRGGDYKIVANYPTQRFFIYQRTFDGREYIHMDTVSSCIRIISLMGEHKCLECFQF